MCNRCGKRRALRRRNERVCLTEIPQKLGRRAKANAQFYLLESSTTSLVARKKLKAILGFGPRTISQRVRH